MALQLHLQPRSASRFAVVLTAVLALLVALVGIDDRASHAGQAEQDLLIAPRDAIMELPTTGPAWDAVVAAADKPLVPDLSDQDNRTPAYAVAAGLVHVRTGDSGYRAKVVEALEKLPGTEFGSGARTLGVGRQLAGWVLAADLVDYREPGFVSWVDGIRTAEIGGHGRWYALTQTHENTANNWGTFAGASRLAASLYVGDEGDVARVAELLAGWLGENTDAWPGLPAGESVGGFQRTSSFNVSWSCTGEDWTPLNSGCGTASSDLDGGLVEELSRSSTSWPDAPERSGFSYSWEALQGIALQGILLHQNGYPDVWAWSNDGPRRAIDYLHRTGGMDGDNFHRVNHWVPWVVDAMYGTSYANVSAGDGRNFGFTDWLGPAIATVAPTGGGDQVGDETEPDPVEDTDQDLVVETEPDPVDDTDPDPVNEIEPGPQDNTEPEGNTGPDPVDETDPDPVDNTEPDPVDNTEPDPVNETEPDPVNETEPDPVNETEPDPVDETETDAGLVVISPSSGDSIAPPVIVKGRSTTKFHRIDVEIAGHNRRAKVDPQGNWYASFAAVSLPAGEQVIEVSARGPRGTRGSATVLVTILPEASASSSVSPESEPHPSKQGRFRHL
jgi:hypothetical protein